jgi:predicted aspartyl protease
MRKYSCIVLLVFFSCCFLTIQSQSRILKKGKVISRNYFEELSFEFEKNKIVIPVIIQGKTYRFLLDTGAPSIISKEVMEALQPEIVETLTASDANNIRQELKVVSVERIKLGSVEFKNFSALVFDLNGNDIFKCFGIDGFIGSNMLRRSIIQIDVRQKTLILTDNIKRLQLDKKQSEKIELLDNQNSPYVWIDVKGKESAKELVLIDTGMGGLYDISEINYNQLKTKNIYNEIGISNGASSLSLFGEVPVDTHTRVHLPKLIINNFEINNAIAHTDKGSHSKIGAELLNFGIMTLDYKNKRFYFEPFSNALELDGDFGFTQTLKDNKLVVGYVWDEDLKSKLTYGDEILQVNDLDINASNFCDFVVKKNVLRDFKTVTLKVKTQEGQILNLKLEKKPLSSIFDNFNLN